MIRVKATHKGFYGNILRKPNEKFSITKEEDFSERWMERLEGQESGGSDGGMDLKSAVASLNREDDAHWTKAGLPDLTVLTEFCGRKVTRKEVEEVTPDVARGEASPPQEDGEE